LKSHHFLIINLSIYAQHLRSFRVREGHWLQGGILDSGRGYLYLLH
jgi:hypothetical protein